MGMAVPALGLRSSGLSNQFWFGHGAGEVKKAVPPGGGYCMVCVQRQWNYDNGLGEKQRKRGWWSLLQSRQRGRSSVNLVWRLGFQISRVEETRTTGSSTTTTTTVLVNCGFQGSADTGVVTKNKYKINLDEYMVTLDRPLGIRFAQTLDGKIFVEALAKQGNAEKSMMIMVGDVLKKTSAISGDAMWDVDDFVRAMHAIKARNGSVSLVLERSVTPLVHTRVKKAIEMPVAFNPARVAVATWNGNVLANPYQGGSIGFVTFTPKFLMPKGLMSLASATEVKDSASNTNNRSRALGDFQVEDRNEVVASATAEDFDGEIQWTDGPFMSEEYEAALARSQGDLTYNAASGISYSKITENIYIGSCIHSEADVNLLTENLGITAVLNLQCKSEQVNWGIDVQLIEETARKKGVVYLQCPIRDVDTVDLRRKLPFVVGVLHRMLRRSHRVYVTCTNGLERSPSCVIGYLHWIQDVSLPQAYEFVTAMHPSGPDRPALVWATWDLIAMVEEGNHKGPPTHSVQFVWNHGCNQGEEVLVVGEFTADWTQPIKANHVSGTKYAVNLRLPQGKYHYKFIVGGHWRHSNSLPTNVDQWGNINNVIQIGDVASYNIYQQNPVRTHRKDSTNIKVIERPLTEDERFTLAFASRRMACSISPLDFKSKRLSK